MEVAWNLSGKPIKDHSPNVDARKTDVAMGYEMLFYNRPVSCG